MSRIKVLAVAAGTVSILSLPAFASSHLAKQVITRPATGHHQAKPKLLHKEVRPPRRFSR
jgi:hypothetical protein